MALLAVAASFLALGWHAPTLVRPAVAVRRAGGCVAQAESNAQDLLIAKLRTAAPDQLPSLIADSMKSIDQRLFLRMAEMADEAGEGEERESIARLASDVANTVQRLIQLADEKLEDDGSKAQAILKVAASDSGEFEVPLPADRADAVRAAVRERGVALDDGFVATIKAYMAKADSDGVQSRLACGSQLHFALGPRILTLKHLCAHLVRRNGRSRRISPRGAPAVRGRETHRFGRTPARERLGPS